MPQISPLMWLVLFFYFLSSLMMFFMKIYFFK